MGREQSRQSRLATNAITTNAFSAADAIVANAFAATAAASAASAASPASAACLHPHACAWRRPPGVTWLAPSRRRRSPKCASSWS